MSSEAPKKLLIKPIIISKKKKMIIKSLANIMPVKTVQQYKEEVIYNSSNCDFLKGESQDVLIVNRLNLISKTCRTIAKCTSRGKTVESSSDSVCSVIGQKNYETVLSALSSVFNQETKVRGILALLSAQKTFTTAATQTEMDICNPNLVEAECQTEETLLNRFVKEKQKKRIRRQPLTPYVVTDRPAKVKKFVVNIDNVKKEREIKEKTPSLPDLKLFVDECSNMSCGSNVSLSSLPSVTGILDNAQKILNGIDKVTDRTLKPSAITLRDGSVIMVPIKPEDVFHIATPEILKNVTHDERLKLIWHQAFIDFKLCLEQDEDGYYPLHIAVLNNDADLVRRQCAALRAKHESVDIPAGGLTALHMSVRQNESTACTNILLQNGADPLLCDQDRRCSLHLAAEIASPQLRCLINYCDAHARSVLKNNLDFWRPQYESRTDEQLKSYLYECVSEMFDDQGYTPLMLAAEAAIPSNVSVLGSRAGALVDAAAPDCGATALYRAVAKACLKAKETGNRITSSDNILKTIEILVDHGADPSVENHSGSSVNTLLTEFNISALSMTIANKMTAMKHGGKVIDTNTILYKHNDGSIEYKDINCDKTEMTEVRNIPPGLHAIITIDVPKTNYNKKKKSDTKDATTVISKDSDSESANSKSEVKSSKSDEMKNVQLKDKAIGNLKDLTDNAILKNANKDMSLKDVNGLPSFVVKASTFKDADKNTNMQVKLGNIVLKQAKTNINMIIKDSLNNAKDKNNIDASKLAMKILKGAKFTENLAVKHNNDVAKQTNIDIEKTIDKISPKVGPNKIENERDPDADKNANLKDEFKTTDIAKTSKELQTSEILVKNTDFADSNEPTRPAKERRSEKVVIVENVALKKVYPIPNILKGGKTKTVMARDILISPRVQRNISKITGNEIAGVKYRKRKLE